MPVARGMPASNDKWRIAIGVDRRKLNNMSDACPFCSIDESVNDHCLIRAQWWQEKNRSDICQRAVKRAFLRKIEFADFDPWAKLPRRFGLIAHRRSDRDVPSAEIPDDIPSDSAGGAGYDN
jgi:hypothetical protein